MMPGDLPPIFPRAFEEDFAAFRSSLLSLERSQRLAAFNRFTREAVRWHTVKGIPKIDVVDRLNGIGLEAQLVDQDIQDALADAVEEPYEPPKASRLWDRRDPSANRHGGRGGEVFIRCAAEIDPQPIQWLWPNRLPIGKVALLAGEPGLGKSQLTCAIAAAITSGGQWPSGEGQSPEGSVIFLCAEDDAADTIRPRLDAAGAAAERVYIISAVRAGDGGRRTFSLQSDLAALERELDRIGNVLLVVIDPVSSYLGKVDSHRNAELRSVLEPLGEMAARRGVAVLAVTHFNKSTGGSANNRVIGSIAFVAAARVAFIVARDKDNKDRRLLLPSKTNVGAEGSGLAFRVEVMDIGKGILAPFVVWDGAVSITADEALSNGSERTAPSREAAETFLLEILSPGAVPTRQIQSEAKAAGISWPAVRRAKECLGVKASKTALDGGWVWTLSARG